MTSSAKR